MRLLFNTLVSYQELSIDEASLEIHITLLSLSHVRSRQERAERRARRDNILLNLDDYTNKKFAGGPQSSTLPRGTYFAVPAYGQICLLLAYTISYLVQVSFEHSSQGTDMDLKKHLKALQKKPSKAFDLALDYFLNKCQGLIFNTPLSLVGGPYRLQDLDCLVQKHNTVIFLFSRAHGNRCVAKRPSESSTHHRRPIFLYEATPIASKPLSHCDVVFLPPKVDGLHAQTTCCFREIRSRIDTHTCKAYSRCGQCRRPTIPAEHYTNYLLAKHMCTRLKTDFNHLEAPQSCAGCGKSFTDRACLEHHHRYCQSSTFCPKGCGSLLTAPGKRPNSHPDTESPLAKKLRLHLCHSVGI